MIIISSLPITGFVGNAKGTAGRAATGVWSATKVWADSKLLYSAKIGDVWPGHPGNEIIVGGESNWTTMIYGHEDSWQAVRLFQEAWYVTNIAIGKVDPSISENQIINVGWHGNVSMIYWDNATAKWVHKELVNGLKAHLAWGYGVAIGPFDPRYPGNQIAVTDDNGQLVLVRKNGTGWAYDVIWKDGGPGITYPYLDTVLLAHVDPTHTGNEILVTGGSKYVTELYYNSSAKNWTVKRLWRDRLAPIALSVGNYDPRFFGNQIAVVGLSKNLTVLHWNGTGWSPERVFQDSDVIYDVRSGEIQPGMGPEIVMGGWSQNVTANHRLIGATAWDSRVIYRDQAFVMGLAIGDCDDLHPGNETIVVDRSGIVTKLQYETPDFVLYSPEPENGAVPGASATFDIMAYSRAGFHDKVSLMMVSISPSWDYDFAPSDVTPTGKSLLTVRLPQSEPQGQVKIALMGASGNKTHTIELIVDVLSPDETDFGFSVLPGSQSVVADFCVRYTVALYQINEFTDPVVLSVIGLPDGATVKFTPPSLVAPGSAIMEICTVKSTPMGLHYLTVIGTGGGKQHAMTVALIVKDASSPDFSIGIAPTTISLLGSHSTNVSVNVVSIYGFAGNVTLSVPTPGDGLIVNFTPPVVVPSGTSIMNITINASVPGDTYYIEVQGASGDTTHSAVLRIDLNLAGNPDFSLTADPLKENITASYSAFFNITVNPLQGFAGKVTLTAQGLPQGAIATFTPPVIGPNQRSRLEIKTIAKTAGVNYNIVVKGLGSGLERWVYIALKVDPAKSHLRIDHVDGIPSTASIGQELDIHIFVGNSGFVDAPTCKMNFYVDGIIQAVKDFQVGVGNLTQINVTWTANSGKHNLTVEIVSATPAEVLNGRYTRTVTVANPAALELEIISALIIIVMIIVLVALAGRFMFGKKEPQSSDDEELEDLEDEVRLAKKKVRRKLE